jgi:Tol biopolymer transport system component
MLTRLPRWSLLLGAFPLLAALPVAAADQKKDESPKWDVNAAHSKQQRQARFETPRGTWMNVDVSPDGRSIAFDMLGDIYLLPIEGGTATRVLGGKAFEIQPRFSPDGKTLAFTSDRGGGDNLWTVALDGKAQPKQITAESFRLLNNPSWTPDGQYLVARKHFSATRSLGAGEMWLYHLGAKAEGNEGLQLTKKKNDQQDAGQPVVSPDGRYVYFSEDVSAGPNFQYNKDPNGTIYAIRRLDRNTGELEDLISIQGGSVSPTPSPDGKSLAFVRRVRENTVLHLLDLDSGEIRPLWDGLSQDQQEAWAIFGPYPNMDWLPDGSAIVTWAQGKLWRVAADGSGAAEIPFTAQVDQTLDEPVRAPYAVEEGDRFAPKLIRDVASSPDGEFIIFHAVGQLWRKQLPNGKPQRFTQSTDFEYAPSFSADGQMLVYTRFNDQDLAAVLLHDFRDGSTRTLTTQPGFYFTPRFSPDGTQVVYSRGGGGNLVDYRFSNRTGIFVQALDGESPPIRVARDGNEPYFAADGQQVLYFSANNGLDKRLLRVPVQADGTAQEVLKLKYVDNVVPSPDGRWLAFTELYNAYVAPLPATGSVIELSKDSKALPITRISKDVGSYLHWAGDGKSLHWMVGDAYHSRALDESFAFLPGAPAKLPEPETAKSVTIGLSVPLDRPEGQIALVGGRIITMDGEQVIEDGTVLVENQRIVAVGKRTDVSVPASAKVIDISGKTLMPGIVDVHAHANHFHNGPSPQANWAYYANLAFGITTMHDPSANTQEVFGQSELVKAGLNVGPRVYSTGTILYGADGDFKVTVNSLDDARSHLRRLKASGAFSVKSYNQPRRDQRQQINQAARELGMIVVMEGGSTFFHNLSMIIDGSTGVEHNLPIAPLYEDVLGLWKATDVRYTPTLVVSYGGLSGEYWWYDRTNVWENQRLLRFFPRETLDARAIRREKLLATPASKSRSAATASCKVSPHTGKSGCSARAVSPHMKPCAPPP